MSAPILNFSTDRNKISSQTGYDSITVVFSSDIPYQKFECRATKNEDEYGVGKGELITSFSHTPAETIRSFEIYDDFLLKGDGLYRISLFAQSEDGVWNDDTGFLTAENELFLTSSLEKFFCQR